MCAGALEMKLLILLLFSLILAATAIDSNDENAADSELVSYLYAKVKRLEAKMARPTLRNTRQVDKPSDNSSKSDDKPAAVKECPPQTVTYIRWGHTTCPYGAGTVYQGAAAGGAPSWPWPYLYFWWSGSPANMMCLPPNPKRFPDNPSQEGSYYTYGVKYQVSGQLNHADNRYMPCAVCEVTGKSTLLMIPSHYQCPTGWRMEYNGYIMAGRYNYPRRSMYNCIDKHLQQISGSRGNHSRYSGNQLYTIHAVSSQFLPYDDGYAMTCVVCTK